MAVAFVRNHTVFSEKNLDTSDSLTISTATTIGNVLVAYVLFDNAGTASKPTIANASSIAVAAGETNSWVFLGAARSTSTSIGAFASAEIWAIRTTVVWPVASYAITLDTSVTQKATLVQEFSGALATLRSTTGTNYSTTTTAASAATTGTTPSVGDLAVGLIFGSNVAAAQAGDTDTTGGSWSAVAGVGSTGGSGATNNFGVAQYKILTGANQQTLNNSAAMTAGNGSIVAILQQYVDPSITQAAFGIYADGTESGSTLLGVQDLYYTANVQPGDVNLLVRVRLQSTTAVTGDSWDDYQLQYDKNSSGWNNVLLPERVLDSHNPSFTSGWLLGVANSSTSVGQSFYGDDRKLTRVGFYLKRSASVDGTLSAVIWPHTATFGVNGRPFSAILTSSTTSTAAAATTTEYAWYYFDFDGTYTLTKDVPYFACLVISGNTTGTVTAAAEITTTTHAGNMATYGVSWAERPTYDLLFSVTTAPVGTPSNVIAFNSTNLTDGAATTNRLTGGTGSFIAGKVSEDGLVDNFSLTGNNRTELLYSLTLVKNDLADADELKFRVVRNGSTTGFTYTLTPRIVISKPSYTTVASHTIVETFSGTATDPPWEAPNAGASFTGGYMQLTTSTGTTPATFYHATPVSVSSFYFKAINWGNQALATWKVSVGMVNPAKTAGFAFVMQQDELSLSNINGTAITGPLYYEAGMHTWFRFRMASDSFFVEISDNGTDWSEDYWGNESELPIGLTDCRYYFDARTTSTEASGSTFLIDNLNTTPAVATGGQPKVYSGGSWVKKPVKVYSGGTWVEKPMKRWNGSAWVPLT